MKELKMDMRLFNHTAIVEAKRIVAKHPTLDKRISEMLNDIIGLMEDACHSRIETDAIIIGMIAVGKLELWDEFKEVNVEI